MRYLFLCLLAMVVGNTVQSEPVQSCDGQYSVTLGATGVASIYHAGRVLGSAKINHALNGGTFSSDGGYLVMFGLPKKTDVRYPQTTYLSIYSIQPKIRLLKNDVYGGGVYKALFSDNQEYVLVYSQLGVDVIDMKKMTTQLHDATYIPPFQTQSCEPVERR